MRAGNKLKRGGTVVRAVTPCLLAWMTGLLAGESAGGVVRAIMPCLLTGWPACLQAGALAVCGRAGLLALLFVLFVCFFLFYLSGDEL